MNLATLLVSTLLYLYGKNFVNTFMLLIFVESAFTLIIGGVYGSLLSSASFHGLERFLRGRYFKKMDTTEQAKEEKNEREALKRESRIGKRFVILGACLFLESILIAFLLIQALF